MIILDKKITQFLTQKPLKHWWDGVAQCNSTSAQLDIFNPVDGSCLTQVALGGVKEVDSAVQSAHRAFEYWSNLSSKDRSLLLHRFADLMESEKEILAQIESLDVGKAITATRGFDIPFGIECIRYFADLSVNAPRNTSLNIANMEARVHRRPYGVCGFIFPWNFPYNLLLWGIIPALAAGNTVVVKPSEVTPLSTLYVAQLAVRAGIPPGVFNVVLGDGPSVGISLTEHPLIRRMSFTGSARAGADVARRCGQRIIPCKLELGGKGAAVLFDDIDVEKAATQLAGAITFNTGQVCCTATRWFVHETIYDTFSKRVVEILQKIKIGASLDEKTEMGPLASAEHKKRVLNYLDQGVKQGAKVLLDSDRNENNTGYFVSPFLLEGSDDNICFREEIFGPTAFVTRFKTEEEAIRRVNQIPYGLANSVWSQDLAKANRVAERLAAGNNWINAHNVFAYGLPYGGIHQSGLGGGVNSPETLNDYFLAQTIARPLT